MEEFVLPANTKGRVLRAKVSGAGGIDATVNYVNHVLTVSQAPSEWVIRVSDGIRMEPMRGGLKLTVSQPLNIIPVVDPSTNTIGYFVADQPPQENVSGLHTKAIPERRKKQRK